MKRKLISLLCILVPLLVMAQAKDYSKAKDYSHWSVVGGVGANVYDGDVTQTVDADGIPNLSNTNFSFGLGLEYAFTPVWGASLEYYYLPYSGNLSDGKWSFLANSYAFRTTSHNIDLNATINFTKLIFPELITKWHVNGSIGIGPSFYKYGAALREFDNSTKKIVRTLTIPEYKEVSLTEVYDRNPNSISIPMSISAEYNFSNSFALGAKFQVRAYNKDDLEGFNYIDEVNGVNPKNFTQANVARKPWRGVTNDMSEAATVYLRYKINAVNKDHLRNISMKEFNANNDLLKLQDEVDGLKGKINDVDGKVNNLVPRVQKLEKMLSNDGPDGDGDGVPDHRDLEPTTPPNTPVDFWGRALKINPPTVGVDVEIIPSVFFDFDKTDLDAEALEAIKKVSAKMKADPSLMVEVRGYTDYMGNVPYNEGLSQRRSEKVKNEMIKVWGIDGNRIIANGKGKIIEPRTMFRPNRRCDFFFSK